MGTVCNVMLLVLLALSTTTAAATDGLDPHFGAGGVALFGPTPVSAHSLARPRGLAVQADGKLLLAGATAGFTAETTPQPTMVAAVARLNADGSWDETFGDHGLYAFPGSATVSTYGGEANQVAVTSDGSIIAAGETYVQPFGFTGMHSCTLMFRLDASGTLDDTFGTDGSLCFDFAPELPNTTYFDHFDSIAIGAGDLIYLTTAQTNLAVGAVARFMSGGTLDASYGSGGIASSADNISFAVLALQPDQRVIATGGPQTYRFTESGQPDPTFGIDGELQVDFGAFPTAYTQSAVLDAEGRLVSGLYGLSGPRSDFLLSRIGADGSLDPTFNGAQQQPGFPGFAAVPLANQSGSLVLAAAPMASGLFAVGPLDFNGLTMGLARLNDDASFDPAYGDPAHPGWIALRVGTDADSYNAPYAMATDASGRLFVSGAFTGSNIGGGCDGIIRIIPDDLFNDGLDPPPVRTCPQ